MGGDTVDRDGIIAVYIISNSIGGTDDIYLPPSTI